MSLFFANGQLSQSFDYSYWAYFWPGALKVPKLGLFSPLSWEKLIDGGEGADQYASVRPGIPIELPHSQFNSL
jgi:hypothetical protein